MGFLDQIKQQADAVKLQQSAGSEYHEGNTLAIEAACLTVLDYFSALAPQFNVLKPPSRGRHILDRQHSFTDLPQTDFRVDSRRKPSPKPTTLQPDLFDHVVMQWALDAKQQLVLQKDFITDIEKLEPKLNQSGAKFDAEDVRDPASRKLKFMRYTLAARFTASVYVEPRHNAGTLCFRINNIDGFDTVTLTFSPAQINTARLDELAKWIVGQPHRFFDAASDLRRVEA
jgi:hypothetical protein